MTIVKSRMCEHSGCEKRPSFGFRLENKKRFCFRHAEDDMINLLLKVCAHSGCTSTANYGHGRTRTHCQPHGERGMTGPKGQMIVSALQPSVWPEEASMTAAAGGVLDVAKAAFLAAAGSAGAGGQNGGDDDVGMAGDLPAVEQPSWSSEQLAPTQEALERERKRVEIERRKTEDAVAARDAAEECGRKAREANENLQKELETVKAGIARALRENEQYRSKTRRVTLPRRCKEKVQEPDQPKEMAALHFRSMHDEVPFVWLKEHFEVEEKPSQIEGHGAFLKRGASKGTTVHTSVLPSSEFNDDFTIEQYDCCYHVMHGDKSGVVYIDPGALFRGNLMGCLEDMGSRVIRLLNHSSSPNAELCLGGAAPPDWYEPTQAGQVVISSWYTCSLVTRRPVEAGEELTICYAKFPPAW
ncbi:unnamed protein product [Ectocarpus sp. 12 AP-2014]